MNILNLSDDKKKYLKDNKFLIELFILIVIIILAGLSTIISGGSIVDKLLIAVPNPIDKLTALFVYLTQADIKNKKNIITVIIIGIIIITIVTALIFFLVKDSHKNQSEINGYEYCKFIEEKGQKNELFFYIFEYKNRLENHIKNLTKNSAVNLSIGLGTAIIGILVIIYLLLILEPPSEHDLQLFHYLSRIFLAFFIELFSLFFIRLYRDNLFEIKYFHNELSNIDSKIIALKTALLKDNDEFIKEVIMELIKVDRNNVLKKGETTIELEKMKCDKTEYKTFVESFKNFTSNKES